MFFPFLTKGISYQSYRWNHLCCRSTNLFIGDITVWIVINNYILNKELSMSGAKFEVKKTKNGQFHFVLKASNGQVILQSETYTRKANCKNGIASVIKNAVLDKAYDVHPKYFNLKSVANGQVVATSEQYNSTTARDNGIASVKKNAPTAELVDLTL